VSNCDSPIIIALDYPDAYAAQAMAAQLDPQTVRVKVGKQLFTAEGPAVVKGLVTDGFDVFLDLKFHDIPNTVAGAVLAAADLGVWMVNVHASGGSRMMAAAVGALAGRAGAPLLTAVTVLTSMGEEDLRELGYLGAAIDRVSALAALAEASGVDGVVCSASEAARLREERAKGFLRVTPGIRLAGDAAGDQRRVLTPQAALEQGATHLVIGRSVTGAADPQGTVMKILQSIKAV
jgi:orotidine-5'-phosphate decarboxylase